jgi:hypothetical protein
MSRSSLWLLQRCFYSERCNRGRYVLGLMSYDGDYLARFQRLAGAHDVLD